MTKHSLDETAWQLVTYREGEALQSVPAGAIVSLQIASGEASGRSAINQYHGNVTLGEQGAQFANFIMTRMAGPPALMALETRYLQLLEQVTRWRRSADQLELLNQTDTVLLQFVPISAAQTSGQ